MLKLRKNKKGYAVFDILFWGEKKPNKIILQKINSALKKSPASEKFIENEWQKRIASGLKPWPNDTQATKYNFNGLKITENSIKILTDSKISYRDIIGSRPVKFRELFKEEYWRIPITVDLILLAKNKMGKKMLGITLRSTSHDYKPGGFHVTTGGAMEIGKDKKPLEAALRETEEECGIKPKELSNILCRGIVFNPSLSELGIIFVAIANISIEEIQSRPNDNENKILFISLKKNNLECWLLEFTNANSYDGIFGMLIVGEELYGKAWKDRVIAKLAEKNRKYSRSQKRKELEKIDIRKLKKWLAKQGFKKGINP